jgi:intracellular multiplication protein IcmX
MSYLFNIRRRSHRKNHHLRFDLTGLLAALFLSIHSGFAAAEQSPVGQDQNQPTGCQTGSCQYKIKEILKEFASGLGIAVDTKTDTPSDKPLSPLISPQISSIESSLISAFLAAFPSPFLIQAQENTPAPTSANSLEQFVTSTTQSKKEIADPISEAILNIISTSPTPAQSPSASAASKTITPADQKNDADDHCKDRTCFLNQIQVSDILGDYYNRDTNHSRELSKDKLNSNILITPMLLTYDADKSNQQTSSNYSAKAKDAKEFISYVTGMPLKTPPASTIKQYGQNAIPAVEEYTATLRTYAARVSVGVSNLYYIFSKRLPQTFNISNLNVQNNQTEAAQPTKVSQAYMEYQMATWRLLNSTNPSQPATWIQNINSASPASIQKEIAILLAEINYQMYLNREQQERILLANSLLVLITSNSMPPAASDLEKALGVSS